MQVSQGKLLNWNFLLHVKLNNMILDQSIYKKEKKVKEKNE
jgi:hypothetical protein